MAIENMMARNIQSNKEAYNNLRRETKKMIKKKEGRTLKRVLEKTIPNNNIDEEVTTLNKMQNVLKSLRNNRAPGKDGISAE
ncbi:hypothetical protein HHI36_003884, partial [Cryptolaemus montrouzieri]